MPNYGEFFRDSLENKLSLVLIVMLIPVDEIKDNENHYAFKGAYEKALEYQLEKVSLLIKKVGEFLDKQEGNSCRYSDDKEFSYHLDALINSLPTITEYYYGWVIFSHIGTTSHKRVKYALLKNDEGLNERIDEIFEKNSIGALNYVKDYKGDFRADCRQAFLRAFDFFLTGKLDEIYAINNYIKHNTIVMGYFPEVTLKDYPIEMQIPYVYIERPFDCLLNSSVYKHLFDYDLISSGKNAANSGYYADIVNSTARLVGYAGGLSVYNINSINYLIGRKYIGISIESIVEISQELAKFIVKVFIDSSKENLTRIDKLNALIKTIGARKSRTLNSSVNT